MNPEPWTLDTKGFASRAAAWVAYRHWAGNLALPRSHGIEASCKIAKEADGTWSVKAEVQSVPKQ